MDYDRRGSDLTEILTLAMEELDKIATDEAIEIPLTMRTRLIHWLARAYDAGRLAERQARPTPQGVPIHRSQTQKVPVVPPPPPPDDSDDKKKK